VLEFNTVVLSLLLLQVDSCVLNKRTIKTISRTLQVNQTEMATMATGKIIEEWLQQVHEIMNRLINIISEHYVSYSACRRLMLNDEGNCDFWNHTRSSLPTSPTVRILSQIMLHVHKFNYTISVKAQDDFRLYRTQSTEYSTKMNKLRSQLARANVRNNVVQLVAR